MTLTLDPTTESLIQREIELGHYREAAEVVAHAVALLQVERREEDGGELLSIGKVRGAIDKAFGIWANVKEDGVAYQERMRSEW